MLSAAEKHPIAADTNNKIRDLGFFFLIRLLGQEGLSKRRIQEKKIDVLFMGFIVPGVILKLNVKSSSRRHNRGVKRIFVAEDRQKDFNLDYKRKCTTASIIPSKGDARQRKTPQPRKIEHITHLPPEILLEIFVESESLHSLGKVNKLFHTLVEHNYDNLAYETIKRKYFTSIRTTQRKLSFLKRRVSNDVDHDHDRHALRTELERIRAELPLEEPTCYMSAYQINILDEKCFKSTVFRSNIFRMLSPDLILSGEQISQIPPELEELKRGGENALKSKLLEQYKTTAIAFPYLDGDNDHDIDYIHSDYRDKLIMIRHLVERDTHFSTPIYQMVNLIIYLKNAYKRAGFENEIIDTKVYQRLIDHNRPPKYGTESKSKLTDPSVIVNCLKFNEHSLLKLIIKEYDLAKLASDLEVWNFILESKNYSYFHQLEKLGLQPTSGVLKIFS
ncbi:hypothetical protein KL911_002562 [Ogataea haglerorum]|uniref:uncharacterized protein n=1 Tax=Ogataea haglerorum TaxID=1937702 RepID=UPI001C8AD614|nr:uncharacterized protein KL911_002562 [Ogataea haglerorum]KAG7748137.1 hypothetical protein KL912_002814 [Ogataea haglerorum]KAG7754086.1 hypothetical protein KL911_002562 [Ogataea haglerorum]